MEYNFDKAPERRGSNSVKYDRLKEVFGKEELLPMWVADMDFQSPPAILEAIKERAEHGVLGYSFRDSKGVESFISWVERRYNWTLSPEEIASSPGIVTALALAVRLFTNPADKILIQTPVYPPFHSIVKESGRELVESPIELIKGRYEINWEDFEKKIATGVKLFILCSSHNPIGRVWSEEELKRMGELAIKYDFLIFSDEIHADLALYQNRHIVLASLSEEIANRTITAMAPSKTFNIAGLLNSIIVSNNSELLSKFRGEVEALHLGMGNVFGHITMEAAYSESEEWLTQLASYLEKNIEFAEQFFAEELPTVSFIRPQSSFLLWLDFRKTGLSHQEVKERLLDKGKIALNDGTTFGSVGEGFFRMNIGAPLTTVKEGLQRIKRAIQI